MKWGLEFFFRLAGQITFFATLAGKRPKKMLPDGVRLCEATHENGRTFQR
jgi:hypothetical protein